MEALFIKLLNMSITASYLVLAVVLLRLLLKKAPKAIFVAMWALVGLRLMVPFSLESIFSLIPSAEPVPEDIAYVPIPTVQTGVQFFNSAVNPVLQHSFAPAPGASVNPMQIVLRVASIVWAVGAAAMLGYCAFSYLRIHRKVREAACLNGRVWLCDSISSPFILGLFRSKIYLPSNMNEQDMEYVLAHENAHLKRRDHLWKPLGFLLLAVYWFNPLMWLAYILLCRDIELACDEKVMKQMGSEAKKPYSEALLNCSVKPRMIAACPLAFGEVGVKDRIKSVLSYKKPAFWIIVVAIVLCIAAVAFFFTNPVSTDKKLSAFIESEILKHHQHDDSEDYFCCTNWVAFGKDKDGAETTLYMWVHYAEFSYDNGVKSGMSALTPTVITVKNNQGNYELVEYWEPRDGAYNDDDILAKFPWYLYPHVFYRDIFVDLDLKACEKKAEEYFSSASIPGASDQELSPVLKDLHEKCPQYFGLDASGGLDVYVWQMAKGSYSFGVLPHSEEKLDWMSPQLMNMPGATAYEMRQILSSYGLDENAVYIIPWQNPLSSYIGDLWMVDSNMTAEQRQAKYDAYIAEIKEMLFGPMGSKELYATPIYNEMVFDIDGDGVAERCVISSGLTQSYLPGTFVINVFYENGVLKYEDVFAVYHENAEYGFAQDENGNAFFLIKDNARELGFQYALTVEEDDIWLLAEFPEFGYAPSMLAKCSVSPFYLRLYEESIEYDIDSDGIVETCGWAYGPTSGLSTYEFSAWENGKLEYFNVFIFYDYGQISFAVDKDNEVYLQGFSRGDDTKRVRIDISIEDGNFVLTANEERLEHWLGRELSKVPVIGEDENSLQYVHTQIYHKTVMDLAAIQPSLNALCQLDALEFVKKTDYGYTTLFKTDKGYVEFTFDKNGDFFAATHLSLSTDVKQDEIDGDAYPLLFVDASSKNTNAYVLCGFAPGRMYSTEDYLYNGRKLSEYIREQDVAVSSNILDRNKTLSFCDVNGNRFETATDGLRCTGRMIDETVEVQAELRQIPNQKSCYLGTYSGIPIFPESITYGNRSISVDLDTDGNLDTISWKFTPANPDLYGEHFHYTVTATIDTQAYTIESNSQLPCKEEDVQIFVADVDLDGNYELIIYSKGMSRFRTISIYQLGADSVNQLLYYIINPEP